MYQCINVSMYHSYLDAMEFAKSFLPYLIVLMLVTANLKAVTLNYLKVYLTNHRIKTDFFVRFSSRIFHSHSLHFTILQQLVLHHFSHTDSRPYMINKVGICSVSHHLILPTLGAMSASPSGFSVSDQPPPKKLRKGTHSCTECESSLRTSLISYHT